MGFFMAAAPVASAETRTLKLYFIHTKERAEITYKRNGRYLQSGLNQINRFLRDWRRNEPAKMDPRLLDLVWEVYRASGARDYIHVVSAYRSPATNAMLRSRSNGVAEKSQHMLGKAMDFYIPGVKLSTLRAAALKKQAGGVGYYPRSGSPFVHLDVGSVRYWPRMSRRELAALFPDGKTLYVPSDGKPMPGYKQALAAYESRKRNGGSIQIANDSGRGRGLLAALFGGGADEAEDNAEIEVAAAPAPARAARRQAPAAQQQPQPQQVLQPQPAEQQRQPESPGTLIAALPAREIPVPRAAPRPSADVGATTAVAAAAQVSGAPLPFDVAPAAAEEKAQQPAETLTALNVPLPTRRPDYTPPEAAVQVAAATETALPAAVAYTPTRRPEPAASADAIAQLLAQEKQVVKPEQPVIAAAYLPVPNTRPGGDKAGMTVAAVPAEAENVAAIGEMAAESVAAKANALAADTSSEPMSPAAIAALKEAALKAAQPVEASPRVAMLENKGVSPSALLSGGAKSTPKARRPRPTDMVGAPEPKVVPVQTVVAKLALSPESVLNRRPVGKTPGFSKEMASAPSAVYTHGFQPDNKVADPRRFTGKAVVFEPLAKFDGE